MDPIWIGFWGIVALFILLATGMHIALAMVLVGAVGAASILGIRPTIHHLLGEVFYSVCRWDLIVLPMFIFVGLLAGAAGLSKNIYYVLSLWLRRVKGGLGIASVASCAAFGTVCGSSLVTAAVFAKTSAPEMRRYGYEKRLTYGLISAAGAIGMLIPPSILIVMYGIFSQESMGKLLIAGITPGLLLTLFFSIAIVLIILIRPSSVQPPKVVRVEEITWRLRISSLVLLWPVYAVALIIIGGIYSGFFSPEEAGAISVALIFFIVMSSKEGRERLPSALTDAASIAAMIYFLFIGATMFGRFLMLSGIVPKALETVIGWNLSHLHFVIAMAIIYLILGCFLDSISMLAITMPIVYPVVQAMKIDPMWYAVVVIMAIECGLITPPVGLNVYGVKGVAESDVTLEDIFIGGWPFFIAMVLLLVLLISFPQLCTFLPNLLMK
ncbi:MAG: TRAP transporter large permease [Deltaproteobacteria bacterium]|nr:TRAP transporter large permease [Deltaproteobacteria bacterium]